MSKAADLAPVQVVFASGCEPANKIFLARFADDADLVVVSEFPAPFGDWIPWHVLRSLGENLAGIRAALAGRPVEVASFLLDAHSPLRTMKFAAIRLRARRLVGYDHNLQPVPISIVGLAALFRHSRWRVSRQFAEGARGGKWLRRLRNPREAEIPFLARRAQLYGRIAGKLRGQAVELALAGTTPLSPGVTVVIPSRDGRELLARLLPTLLNQFTRGEVIVSDNGSGDGTAAWLAELHPHVRVIVSDEPLSFAKAVNRGIVAARYSRVFLLNNDMVLEPGCVAALWRSFEQNPELFCSTAQIFFPQGIRREETGKAVWRTVEPLDFPVRCDDPLRGEDGTWVLYGSGGCSLFDTEKLRALGGVSEVYEPAYVEDMDFGYRAWKRGWATVYCDGAKVEHRHRATTARFFTELQLQFFVERNYLRFLIYSIGTRELFITLWARAIRRLQLLAMRGDLAALETLRNIPKIAGLPEAVKGALTEDAILALGNGDVAVFPGRGLRAGYPVMVVSPYLPFPLSHGGAVRMFHLLREANRTRMQVLVSFVEELCPVPDELLDICAEVVLVKRHGTHYRKRTERPDVVEEFASESLAAALRQTVLKWSPVVAQLEFTQMAQYAGACRPAKTVLVEHDITFDLLGQLAQTGAANLESRQQLERWKRFELDGWQTVDRVVTMSEKDRRTVGPKGVALPNGVDTERFQPGGIREEKRILFLGSFAHLPNLLALAWFVGEVWPLLGNGYALHVIAGARPEFYLDFHRGRVSVNLAQPGIELEGFVSDVRPAYRRAAMAIAPLTASAGTNIKVLEAMAMGRCVVSTSAGINGLDLVPGVDLLVADTPADFAAAVESIAVANLARGAMEQRARRIAVERFDWRAIGCRQAALYDALEVE